MNYGIQSMKQFASIKMCIDQYYDQPQSQIDCLWFQGKERCKIIWSVQVALTPLWPVPQVCNLMCQTYSHSCLCIWELLLCFKQELGIYPWTMRTLNSLLRKNTEIHQHTARALQKYDQTLVPCSRAIFEEVMSAKQQNTYKRHNQNKADTTKSLNKQECEADSRCALSSTRSRIKLLISKKIAATFHFGNGK